MAMTSIGGFGGVEAAIRRAATATGVDFDFLLKTARRESGLNPRAKAPTSSATGLFQFVDQTWLKTLKQYGARHGLGRWADMIQTGADGRLHVTDPSARRAVLDLRMDPQAAALMAGEMTADHAAYLKGRTGREPSAGDLYAAHFLGPAGSARLMEAMQSRPNASAAGLFPDAAHANHSIFFHDGRPATVAQLYANLNRVSGGGGQVVDPTTDAQPADALSDREIAIAQRMDRLRRDEALLGFMNQGAGAGGSGSLVEAQLLGAFGPGSSRDS
ncbi:MAG: transglycosylase SLT domain-containing protein [Proteobacteria bacterium]|nr:transglycosylase SLT domain-containing protein [Pseudomonadota bacterium]